MAGHRLGVGGATDVCSHHVAGELSPAVDRCILIFLREGDGVKGDAPLLEMRGIRKAFSGRRVLHGVDFDVHAGEVHVLAGENGAGKSTLVRILNGVYADFEGRVLLEGVPVRFRNPHEAASGGVSMIHQEMSLVPEMSVRENVLLGCEPVRGGWIDRRRSESRARQTLARVGLSIDLDAAVSTCSLADRQRIEIAKALARNARVLVLDEPTSALSDAEVERLFEIMMDLKRSRCGLVYITHRLSEIYRVADRITVLRDGVLIGTASKDELPQARLLQWMVGRKLDRQFPPRHPRLGAARLEVHGFHVPDSSGVREWAVEDVSLSVRAGEILGIGGLHGAGGPELLAGIFGCCGRRARGTVNIDGRPRRIHHPRAAIDAGLCLLSSDRRRYGLVGGMSVVHNITRAALRKYSPGGWLLPRRERRAAELRRRELGIRFDSLEQSVQELSGGNQQKVVLAHALETTPKVLLLDEPTRGVDVGAKHEMYKLLNKWTAQGLAVVLITSEMQELLALSDRVLVLHRGRCARVLTREAASQEAVLGAAMGVT